MMPFLVALLTLAFARPTVQPAKDGQLQFEEKPANLYYVISAEGVFRVEKHKAQRAPKRFHPAFVFSSETKFRIGIKPVEDNGVTLTSNQVRYSDGFIVHKGPTASTYHEVDSAFAVILTSGEEYLLIKWQGDPGKCEFSLFKVDDTTLKEASTNAYACPN